MQLNSMTIDIAFSAIAAVLALGEFYVWYSEVLWHKDGHRDPRNDPPER
jgi:hypothetical protein